LRRGFQFGGGRKGNLKTALYGPLKGIQWHSHSWDILKAREGRNAKTQGPTFAEKRERTRKFDTTRESEIPQKENRKKKKKEGKAPGKGWQLRKF